MDYEKLYKKALKRARKLATDLPNGRNDRLYHVDDLEYIFSELKELEDERIRKELVFYLGDMPEDTELRNGVTNRDVLDWLEKQGGQSTDKVEPKFKVGDWVVDSQGLTHQIERVVENVTTHTFGYDIVGGGYFNDDNEGVHLWTIQDAKDGDVLVTTFDEDNMIVMYHSMCTKDIINVHCCLDNKFVYWNLGVFDAEDVKPATKEQRDILFQKMKEAGYEWDAEKKELKKIKIITPLFNVGDTIIKKHNSDINKFGKFRITAIIDNKYWYRDRIICDITEQDEWELYEPVRQQLIWSEEDDKMVYDAIGAMGAADYYTYDDKQKIENWLKSLKERMKGE